MNYTTMLTIEERQYFDSLLAFVDDFLRNTTDDTTPDTPDVQE